MTNQSPKKHGHKHLYTVTVTADTAEEAIEIAAEALPRGANILTSNAVSVGNMGWDVSLTFTGGDRRTNDPSA